MTKYGESAILIAILYLKIHEHRYLRDEKALFLSLFMTFALADGTSFRLKAMGALVDKSMYSCKDSGDPWQIQLQEWVRRQASCKWEGSLPAWIQTLSSRV
jgi:hypothetical protein